MHATPASPHPLPVICDRCAARGQAGGELFALFGDLMSFEPVPRLKKRADGWDHEAQRVYIAALALTGSDRQAAHAVGKAQFGVTQLKNARGNESFLAAREKALAFFEAERTRRRAEGLRAAASFAGHRHAPVPAAWSGAATRQLALPAPTPPALAGEEALTEAEMKVREELLRVLLGKYLIKLEAEREARMAGCIVAADFYLRQITALEVSLDVVSGDGMAILRNARLDGHDLRTIAETDMSMLLDEARRRYWESCGDPPRPSNWPPRHLLVECDGYAVEPLECTEGGLPESHEEQRRRQLEQHAKDAEEQVKWEAQARRDYEDRRDSDAAS